LFVLSHLNPADPPNSYAHRPDSRIQDRDHHVSHALLPFRDQVNVARAANRVSLVVGMASLAWRLGEERKDGRKGEGGAA